MDQVILDIKNVCFRWKNSGSLLLNLPEFKIEKHEHVFYRDGAEAVSPPYLHLLVEFWFQNQEHLRCSDKT